MIDKRPQQKRCPHCAQTKEADAFLSRKRGDALVLESWCKECRSAQRRAAYERDPERAKESNARWKEKNPDKIRAYSLAAYHRHKGDEKYQDYQKAYVEAHKEKIRAYGKEWHARKRVEQLEAAIEWMGEEDL